MALTLSFIHDCLTKYQEYGIPPKDNGYYNMYTTVDQADVLWHEIEDAYLVDPGDWKAHVKTQQKTRMIGYGDFVEAFVVFGLVRVMVPIRCSED